MRTRDRKPHQKQPVKSTSHIPLIDDAKLLIGFLEAVIEHIPYPLFIKDRKHRWVVLNQAFSELLGHPRQKMLGKSDYDFFPKEQAAFFWKKDEEMYRTGRVIDIPEEPITDKEGKLHWVHTRKAPLMDSSGKIIHLLGIIEDVTEHRETVKALQASEERYRKLFDNVGQGILVADIETMKFYYANPTICKMLGYTEEELRRMGVADIHPKGALKHAISEFETMGRGKTQLTTNLPCLRKNGTTIYVDINATKILIDGRKCNVGFFTDITERKKAEEERHKIEEKYRLVVENANEAIVVAQEGNLKFVNTRMIEALGYSEQDLLSTPFAEFIHPDDRKTILERNARRMKGKDVPSLYDFRVVNKKGKVKWVRINAVAITWEGKPATLNFLTDVTEHKEMEQYRDQYREQKMLFDLTQLLSTGANLEGLLEVAAKKTTELLGIERCTIVLANENRNSATLKAIHHQRRSIDPGLIGFKFTPDVFTQLKKMVQRKPHVIENTSSLPKGNWLSIFFETRGIKSTLIVPLISRAKFLGMLAVSTTEKPHHYTEEETRLLQIISNPIAVAIDNNLLMESLKKQADNLKDLTSDLMKAQEKEREKLSKELHDQVGQMLQSMKMNLDRIKRDMPTHPKMEFARDRLMDTGELLTETIEEVRSLTFALRPAILDDFGLTSTLKWYVDDYARRSEIKVITKFSDEKFRYPAAIDSNLYRIIQEVLNNVHKHASATKVTISLSQKDSTVLLSVTDNGKGFDVQKTLSHPHKGTGISNMKERVNLLGGNFQISSQPEKGTKINIKIPLPEVRQGEDPTINR